jgi:hypothetical protein
MSEDQRSFAEKWAGLCLVFARFERHRTSRPMARRDVPLDRELLAVARALHADMTSLAAKIEDDDSIPTRLAGAVQGISEIEREIASCEGARAVADPVARVAILRERAAAQIDRHDAQIAGKDAVTRRPAVLSRIVDELREVRVALGVEAATSEHGDFLVSLDERIATYERELAEIRRARVSTPLDVLLVRLGSAAQEVASRFRSAMTGSSAPSLADLEGMGDELAELLRQMSELRPTHDQPEHDEDLRVAGNRLLQIEQACARMLRAR